MIDELLRNLAGEITPSSELGVLRLRQGVIDSVEANGTATVKIGGNNLPIPGVKVASHVCPIPGVPCWIAVDGRDAIILATLAPAGVAFGRMRQSVAQNIPNGGYNRVSFTNRTAVRTQGITAGNNGFTVVVPGWYQVNSNVVMASAAASRRGLRILVGGSVYTVGNLLQSSGGSQSVVTASALVEAAIGELIEVEVLQDSGGTLATGVGSGQTLLDVTWVRPIET